MSYGWYSTVTFGPHGEVLTHYELVPIVDMTSWAPAPSRIYEMTGSDSLASACLSHEFKNRTGETGKRRLAPVLTTTNGDAGTPSGTDG